MDQRSARGATEEVWQGAAEYLPLLGIGFGGVTGDVSMPQNRDEEAKDVEHLTEEVW